MPPADADLLRRYAEEKSDSAFAELVQRHVGFVYACALRRVGGDAHLARDVTQQVFIALARHARKLTGHAGLSGWLYVATRNATAQVVRGERRRQLREQKAHLMNELTSAPDAAPDWTQLRDVLDEGLDTLDPEDRQAVLLRFFEGRTFADIGASFRLTENAARMRVERALDKLHVALKRRGVTSTAAALGVALAHQPTLALPSGLAAGVTSAALAGAGGLALATPALALAGAAVLAVAGWLGWSQHQANRALQNEIAALHTQVAGAASLRAENDRLAREAAEVARLRGDDTELARLAAQAADLREKLRSGAARDVSSQGAFALASAPPAMIQGKIMKPGRFGPTEGSQALTLQQLLEQAGGLATTAAGERIRITRTRADGITVIYEKKASVDGSFPIMPGDVVYVPEKII